MSAFEWWQILLGLIAVLVPAALTVLGRGFTNWANKLEAFSRTVDKRLDKMHSENVTHWEETSNRLHAQEKELGRIHLCVEKRLTRLETKTDRA